MGILITTSTQLDTIISTIETHIKTLITDTKLYAKIVTPIINLLNNELGNLAFRNVSIEGITLIYKRISGIFEFSFFDYQIVKTPSTALDGLNLWCSKQFEQKDINPNNVILFNYVEFINLNTNQFSKFINTTTLQVI